MTRAIIAITAGRYHHPAEAEVRQQVEFSCPVDYVQSINDAGGAAVLLPPVDDMDAVKAVISSSGGLLLSGGGDIQSLNFGQQPHPECKYQDPIRDKMELHACRLALEMNKPILGICRGIQLINVAMGGSLVQDIPTLVPNAIQHRTSPRIRTLAHTVMIEENSLLESVLGTSETTVNSWHHQAVDEVGRGLAVNARASDGVIEGLESSAGRAVLALQCHPEDIAKDYPLFRKLFEWLVLNSEQ